MTAGATESRFGFPAHTILRRLDGKGTVIQPRPQGLPLLHNSLCTSQCQVDDTWHLALHNAFNSQMLNLLLVCSLGPSQREIYAPYLAERSGTQNTLPRQVLQRS